LRTSASVMIDSCGSMGLPVIGLSSCNGSPAQSQSSRFSPRAML
jgi:hypothetical protein